MMVHFILLYKTDIISEMFQYTNGMELNFDITGEDGVNRFTFSQNNLR